MDATKIACDFCGEMFKKRGIKIHMNKCSTKPKPEDVLDTELSMKLEEQKMVFEKQKMEMQMEFERVKMERELALEKQKADSLLEFEKLRMEQELAIRERELAIKERGLTLREVEMDRRDAIEREKFQNENIQRELDRQNRRDLQDQLLQHMTGVYHVEREMVQEYQKMRLEFSVSTNNRPRLLSSAPRDLHQRDELVIYGTVANPWVRKTDLEMFIDGVILPDSAKELHLPMQECVDSIAFDATVDEDGKETHGVFCAIEHWDDISRDVETKIGLPTKLVATHIRHLCQHLPYSEDFGKQDFDYGQDLPIVDTKPPVLDDTFFASSSDDSTASSTTTLATITIGDANMTLSDRIGATGESVSAFKLIRQKTKKLRDAIETWIKKTPDTRLWNGMAHNRARLYLLKKTLRRKGIYTPDAINRYTQDQLFQKHNQNVHPMTRTLFYRKHFHNDLKFAQCGVCRCGISFEDFERGHIVPSKRGHVGSNGDHNMIPMCSSCNRNMGAMDPYLFEKYTLFWVVSGNHPMVHA